MKKGLFLLFILLGLLVSCTDSPTEPGPPDGGGGGGGTTGYSISLAPEDGSAFITGDLTLTENEIIEITATVRKDGTVVTDRIQVIFEIIGTGAAFVESGTAYYNTYTVNGTATATLFSTVTGTFTIKATARFPDNKSAYTTKNYTFFEDPHLSITSVSPTTGSSAGGETVTITGTGFMQPLEVYFGDERAQFVTGTSTEMTVTTPVHYSSDCNVNDVVDVRVVIFPGQPAESSDTASDVFTFLFEALPPTVTGIDPNHGDTDGGTLVTVYGTNFYCGGEGLLVYFNEVSAPVVSCSPDKLVVKSPPAHDVGIDNCTTPVSVRVLNLCGGFSYSLADSFKYGPKILITAWGPTQGDAIGGTPVTIYGQGFDSPLAVTLAGVGAQVVSVSNNEIYVLSGAYDPQGRCGNQTGPITVTDIECATSAESDSGAWTYISPEVFISSVENNVPPPPPYPVNSGVGGDSVTIFGSGMIPPLEVFFGDSQGIVSLTAADFTTAVVTVPIFTGEYLTQPCDAGGCVGEMNLPTPVDVTVRSVYTGCTYTFKSFFYIPTDVSCRPAPPTCANLTLAGIGSPVCQATFSGATTYCGAAITYSWNVPGGVPAVGATNPFVTTMPGGTTSAPATVTGSTIYGAASGCTVTATLTAIQCP